jgi:hypothetical protein
MKKVKPVEGFKVMEWLRNVREKEYKLYREDPQTYYRQTKIAGERLRAYIDGASENLS